MLEGYAFLTRVCSNKRCYCVWTCPNILFRKLTCFRNIKKLARVYCVYKSLPGWGGEQKDNMPYFIFIGVIHLVFIILDRDVDKTARGKGNAKEARCVRVNLLWLEQGSFRLGSACVNSIPRGLRFWSGMGVYTYRRFGETCHLRVLGGRKQQVYPKCQ